MAKKISMTTPHQKREVEIVLQGASLIKDSIRVVASMQKIAKLDFVDLISSVTIAIGDTIIAFANATDTPTNVIQKMFIECLNEHVSQYKAEAKQNN